MRLKTGSGVPFRSRPAADHAWVAGMAGALLFPFTTFLYARHNILQNGISAGPFTVTDRGALILITLFTTGAVMIAVDLALRAAREGRSMISVSPLLRTGSYTRFAGRCVLIYATDLLLITAAIWVYEHAKAYADAGYGPWLMLIHGFRHAYLWLGLPYIALTRALQHDERDDRKSPTRALWNLVLHLKEFPVLQSLLRNAGRITGLDLSPRPFTQEQKTALLGLLVKSFFIPIMTLFYITIFNRSVEFWTYFQEQWLERGFFDTLARLYERKKYFYDMTTNFMFIIDVGVGWCGYFFMSRWVKNTYVSVEPTFFGWAVAIICYPPFNNMIFAYFDIPPEDAFNWISLSWLKTFMIWSIILSYVVYVAATVVFGLRFSNLTHRGVIRTGVYRYIRHPAYAAKNFSWWCAMFPAIAFMLATGKLEFAQFAAYTLGLITMSSLYYWRAITEERHLMADPEYREYCREVKYRFIPGVV